MKNSASGSARKILHIGDYWDGGGAEKVLRQTVRLSEQLGTENRVYTATAKKLNPISYVFSLRTAKEVKRLLTEFCPDVVHVQNFYHKLSPSVLFVLRSYKRQNSRVRIVHTAHDMHLISPNSGFQFFKNREAHNISLDEVPVRILRRYDSRSVLHSFLKIAQNFVAYRLLKLQNSIDLVITPSNFLGDLIDQHQPQLPIRVVRNPVGVGQMSSQPLLSPANEDVPKLVYFGRISAEKGLEEFIQLCSKFFLNREITLDIFGDGPCTPALEQLIDSIGIRDSVILRGPIEADQVQQRMREYSVLILPSTWYENAPLVICEAASVGLPVLARNVGGVEELVNAIRWGIANELTDVEQTLDDIRALAKHTGENKLNDPDEFSEERYKSELNAIYGSR